MSRAIFVDASAWVAVANKRDNNHSAAVEVYPRLLARYQRLLTSSFVVAETYILLRNDLGFRAAAAFLENFHASSRIERVLSTADLEREAEQILRRYDDQDFSYVDAVSFALMQVRGLKEAFTFDKHFATLGFQCIPSAAR